MNQNIRHGLRAALLVATASLSLPAAAADEPFTVGAGFVSRIPSTDGKLIYERICQGCHMADGRGARGAGAYPALAGNPKLAAKAYPAYVVVRGMAAMPSFGMFMDDAQVAAVVNYIRGNFGNKAPDSISAAEVATIRSGGETAGRNLKGR
jgi:mono/diheme cytochrome c family protein